MPSRPCSRPPPPLLSIQPAAPSGTTGRQLDPSPQISSSLSPDVDFFDIPDENIVHKLSSVKENDLSRMFQRQYIWEVKPIVDIPPTASSIVLRNQVMGGMAQDEWSSLCPAYTSFYNTHQHNPNVEVPSVFTHLRQCKEHKINQLSNGAGKTFLSKLFDAIQLDLTVRKKVLVHPHTLTPSPSPSVHTSVSLEQALSHLHPSPGDPGEGQGGRLGHVLLRERQVLYYSTYHIIYLSLSMMYVVSLSTVVPVYTYH